MRSDEIKASIVDILPLAKTLLAELDLAVPSKIVEIQK